MSIVKQSFISNIISKSTYDQFLGYAKVIVAVGSCLLAICIGLSFFFHSSIINWFLQLLTGTSLLFIAYNSFVPSPEISSGEGIFISEKR